MLQWTNVDLYGRAATALPVCIVPVPRSSMTMTLAVRSRTNKVAFEFEPECTFLGEDREKSIDLQNDLR